MNKYDELDIRILNELINDSSISVPTLAKMLNTNASLIYSRIKRLVKKGIINGFTVTVNEGKLGINFHAIIGINIDPRFRQIVRKELLNIPEIRNISEVSGRFDIFVNVGATNLENLHQIIMDKIGKIEGIINTETFIEMRHLKKDYNLKTLLSV